jgi:carbamoyltransferase
VVFFEKPFLKFERLLESYLALAPRGLRSFQMALPLWIQEKLFQKDLLSRELLAIGPDDDWASRLLFAEHHQSHAASAFFPSPFEDALVLTMDGVGEWATTSTVLGAGNRLDIISEIHYPHSLGLLYSAFTYYAGFKVNSGEYKVMGLAPYGEPIYAQRILEHLIDVKPDGSFRLNLDYFDCCTGLTMTNLKFSELCRGPPRQAEERLTQRHMDLAAGPGSAGRSGPADDRLVGRPNRRPQSVYRRRRGPELRRQRQGAASREIQRLVDPAGRRRRGSGIGRRARGILHP